MAFVARTRLPHSTVSAETVKIVLRACCLHNNLFNNLNNYYYVGSVGRWFLKQDNVNSFVWNFKFAKELPTDLILT